MIITTRDLEQPGTVIESMLVNSLDRKTGSVRREVTCPRSLERER